MRAVPASMTEAWEAEDKTGERRPMVRATVQKVLLKRHLYDTAKAPGGRFEYQRHRKASFTTLLMGEERTPREIRNIKSFTWTRSVNQDVAEATMTILNSELVALGLLDEGSDLDTFERPGFFTPTRGEPGHAVSPFGYSDNDRAWNGLLVPDRLVCTYEGYGCDLSAMPGRDPYLMQSGTWLIDEVTIDESGDLVLKMRDVGRLLLDMQVFPPCIPHEEYPMQWSTIRTEQVQGRDVDGGSWERLDSGYGYASSSNDAYVGKGFTNAPYSEYVGDGGVVNKHRASHVLSSDNARYWLSTGQDGFRDRVWWQIDFNDSLPVSGVRIKTKGGPYRVYISLHDGQKWLGQKEVGYEVDTDSDGPGGVDVKAGIPYVYTTIADRNISFEHVLKRVYPDVTKMRLTFSRLQDNRIGEHPFNAGLREVHIYTGLRSDLGFAQKSFAKSVGNISDYTDVVKWVLAWCGWFWPPHSTDMDYVKFDVDDKEYLTFASPDPVLPRGRVWGDLMDSGTAPQVGSDLTADLFDKQPMMDVISRIRDITQYSFWIDETGAAVWRMPNLFKVGNFVTPTRIGAPARARTSEVITLNTDDHLLSLSVTSSSRNLRERIFVANTTGKTGVVIKGYRPYQVGFRRVAGWTDANFKTKKECRVTAGLIAIRQMFDYRRARFTIPANPAIQIDDQVRLLAPVTNEMAYHYVESISSSLDMRDGSWTYDIESHWLGENPEDAWAVKTTEIDVATKNYLNTIGVL